jgi:hypothetical protein
MRITRGYGGAGESILTGYSYSRGDNLGSYIGAQRLLLGQSKGGVRSALNKRTPPDQVKPGLLVVPLCADLVVMRTPRMGDAA